MPDAEYGARAHFLSDAGDLESAALRLGAAEPKPTKGLPRELDAAVEAMRELPWTVLQKIKGNPDVLKRIEDAEVLLKLLRGALS